MSNEAIILLDEIPNLGLENCEEIVFTVTATNSLGSSKPGNVSGGFPNGMVPISVFRIIKCACTKLCLLIAFSMFVCSSF